MINKELEKISSSSEMASLSEVANLKLTFLDEQKNMDLELANNKTNNKTNNKINNTTKKLRKSSSTLTSTLIESSSTMFVEKVRLKEEEFEKLINKLKKIIRELQMLNNYDKELLMIKQNLVSLHGPRQTCSFHVNRNLAKEMDKHLQFYKNNSNFSKSDFVNMALYEFIEKYKAS